MQTTIRLQSLTFGSFKTYLAAVCFILGNVLLPQLCHLLPDGGVTWLPIYFFTLVGAYVFGWRVGLLTALASPVVNSLLFGMPAVAVVPAIILKSVLLAGIAGWTASHCRKVSFPAIAAVVIGYQALGTLGEWALAGDFMTACQDFRIGIPGMILQMTGGWLVIKMLTRR